MLNILQINLRIVYMQKKSINPFDKDITLNGGYLYTTNAILSSRLANERLTVATANIVKLTGKKVIDVGCGDGVYTNELFKQYHPKQIIGVDSSINAIKLAQVLHSKNERIQFKTCSIYDLNRSFSHFDIAIVRGVIHHVENPQKAIASVTKIASDIIILEPNGYNPILKIVERISLYHRIHKEKSYFPYQIRKWLEENKFKVIKDQFVGFVPFFCPDGMARPLKKIEPYIENLPFIRNFLCGVYVVHAKKYFAP